MEMDERAVTRERPANSAPIPLLATKISIPGQRAGIVPRTRLTARLEQDYRLALVVAPAGWGKSSVLSEWCAQQSDPHSVAWVSLDTGDSAPTRFLLYITAAFDRAYPGLGEATRNLLQSPQSLPPDVVLTILLNEISALDRSLTLVLDDYHLIEAQPVHEAMTFLLDHLPPTLRLIIATRVDPPLPLSRLRVRGQLTELRASELRFTHDEATAFLNQVMGLDLEVEAVSQLEARTEGWIAGLQLAAISLQGSKNPTEFLDSFTGTHRYIVDYLFDEVLSQQSESVQTFLQETSILNRLCKSLCEAVTEQSGGQALLEKLEADNLFLIPLDEERHWYRYHHLFADVLQARLAQQGAERTAELHKHAAVWFHAQGMGEEAVHHALVGKHLELAAEYVEAYSNALWIRGGQRTVEQWLKAFPEDWVRSRPVLSVIQSSMYLYDLRLAAAIEILDNCRFEARENDPVAQDIRGRMATIRGTALRIQGDFETSLTQIREALVCLSQENSLWRGLALFNLGVLLYERDAPAEAKQPLFESLEESRKGNNPFSHLSASLAFGQVHEAQGALREANRIYQEALAFATERKFHHTGDTAFIFSGLSRCAYQWNDLAAAETYLKEGLERKHPAYALACYLELARLKHTQGDVDGLAALMPPMDAILKHMTLPWLASAVTAMKIRVEMLEGDAVTTWVQEYEARPAGKHAQRVPMHGLREVEAVTWAQTLLADGSASRVRARLETMLETLAGHGLHGSALEIRVLLATIYQQESRMDSAVTVLEPALVLAAQEGYVRVFLDAGKSLVPVLREAAARGIEPQTVASLLDTFRAEGLLQEKQKAEQASSLFEPLSERELEVLRLVGAGMSNPEIAEHLFLSVGTIKRHVYNIYTKLEVTGRVEAITRARELKLL
jgi:LuxR family transcriptional regulator, maltose regulon positive regulatory protein